VKYGEILVIIGDKNEEYRTILNRYTSENVEEVFQIENIYNPSFWDSGEKITSGKNKKIMTILKRFLGIK